MVQRVGAPWYGMVWYGTYLFVKIRQRLYFYKANSLQTEADKISRKLSGVTLGASHFQIHEPYQKDIAELLVLQCLEEQKIYRKNETFCAKLSLRV